MPGPLAITSECCQTRCSTPVNIQVPGPAGTDGVDGSDGEDGVNAFTTTTAQFLMPSEGSTVSVQVLSTQWMAVGQILFVKSGGYMEVISITNLITVVLKNLEDTAAGEYSSNVAPATAIPAGSKVSPGGKQGPSGGGAATASVTSNELSVTMAATRSAVNVVSTNLSNEASVRAASVNVVSAAVNTVSMFLAGVSARSATASVKGLQSVVNALSNRISAVGGTLYGAGAPGAGLGTTGNTYWDTTNKDLYVKDLTGWLIIIDVP